MIVVGLMSGTSADGTDVAVVQITGAPPNLAWQLLHYSTLPHPPELQSAILSATVPATGTVDKLCALNVALGEQFAHVALAGIAQAGLTPQQVDLIGSHGQTVWHNPDTPPLATLQLGEAAVIAERVGVPVISNFRARDMAVGGQGAPLVAYVDQLLLTDQSKIRAAQNIGGIGNVTFLPPHNRPDLSAMAFDTGPGNVLLDEAVNRITAGQLRYDRDGLMAAQGRLHEGLLAEWLAHPFFGRKPPKTTGRELFSAEFSHQLHQQARQQSLSDADFLHTLTALTAYSIADAYRAWLPTYPTEVIVSGGGADNPMLMGLLATALAPATVLRSDQVGIASDAKEALAFAILAYETWHQRPSNLPTATGASRRVVLGQLTW